MERSEIIFALGPTNTGKTFRAIARMKEYETGMMGLPLRLLAREVYDKVSEAVGESAVALITGEEKRIPARPRFWICTVEAMPLEIEVDFLAVDEIQLAAHQERGHVFTQRLLHARGRKETWFMGSDTILTLAEQLVPTGKLRRFPRFSELKSEGFYTLGSLPRRSAVVAFSATRVYETAEKIRARRGGAAIVLGALSPRARNAQVAMYQAGEVDYLVATDAIGMGLNLDIDRVAFADTRKFDGHEARDLQITELAQIAGRAGRHLKNGAFGTFGERLRLPPNVERAIEDHRFPSERRLVWRNPALDFSSPKALLESLLLPPKIRSLRLVSDAEDTKTLSKLLEKPAVIERLRSEADLRLLWDVCQVPDYRKLLLDEHANLVFDLFSRLQDHGHLSADWIGPRIERLENHPGDIETIMSRIAFVRTWTYVAAHSSWTDAPDDWRKRTGELEDGLSDALHLALVERFVERKTRSVDLKSPPKSNTPTATEKSLSGQLAQLMARYESAQAYEPSLLERIVDARHEEFSIELDGGVHFGEMKIAQLRSGRRLLEPDISLLIAEPGSGMEHQLLRRLRAFVRDFVAETLGFIAQPLPSDSTPAARGLIYQLSQELGSMSTKQVSEQIKNLAPAERERFERAGLQFGEHFVYGKNSLKPKAVKRRAILLRTYEFAPVSGSQLAHAARLPHELRVTEFAGDVSFRHSSEATAELLSRLGYLRLSKRAVRQDVVERILREAPETQRDRFPALVAGWIGCRRKEAQLVLKDVARRFQPGSN